MVGNDDLKSQGSDGGEVSSPGSENDHNSRHHPFHEVEKSDAPPVRSIDAENISVEVVHNDGEEAQKVVEQDVGVVEIARELSIEQISVSKDVSIEHVESVKKSYNRSSSSSSSHSSSSSSDNELRIVEKDSVASEPNELNKEVYAPTSGGDSLTTEVTYVSDNAPQAGGVYNLRVETEHVPPIESATALLDNSVNSHVAELGTKEKDEQLIPSLEEITRTSVTVIDSKLENFEDKVLPLSYEYDGGSSSANGVVTKENGDKLSQSSNDPILETSTCEECIKDSDIPKYSENQVLIMYTFYFLVLSFMSD